MDTYLVATYEDGYTHDQRELNDTSLWEPKHRNTFYDIINGLPEPEHGPLQYLVLHTPKGVFTLDWQQLPPGAKPIFFKRMERDFNVEGWTSEPRVVAIDFGYEYVGEDGKNHKHVENI